MSLDPEVKDAIYEVAKDLGQNKNVANSLIQWLMDMSKRELSVKEDYDHLNLLKNLIQLKKGGKE